MIQRKIYSEDFKRSAVERCERETITMVAESLGISYHQLYGWRETIRGKSEGKANGNSERIYWNDEEIKAIADKWVALRQADPFNSAIALFEKAQRQAIPGERQRDVTNMTKTMRTVIEQQWRAALNNQPAAPVLPPEPQIITIEVPRKLTAKEMLDTLDEPTIKALLSAKELARETAFHEILRGIAVNAGATGLPDVKTFVPRLEVFDAGEKRTRRIAIVGLPNQQQDETRNQILAAGLDVELRFPTPKDSLTVGRCDYAIICRVNGHDQGVINSVGDRTIGQLGRNRVVLVEDTNTVHLVQQVRNICSRQ